MNEHAILVPTYNSAKTIIEALRSIQKANTTLSHFLVIDNCSQDNTVELVRQNFPEIELIVNSYNKHYYSVIDAINILKHQYRYLSIYHSDDIYYPEIIEKSISAIKNDRLAAVFTRYEEIDEKGRIIRNNLRRINYPNGIIRIEKQRLLEYLVKDDSFIFCPSVLFDLECLDAVGGIDVSYGPINDTELYLRLNQVYALAVINKVLVKYRRHDKQDSKRKCFTSVPPRVALLRKFILKANIKSKFHIEKLLNYLQQEEDFEKYLCAFLSGTYHKYNPNMAVQYLMRKYVVDLKSIVKLFLIYFLALIALPVSKLREYE